MALEFTPVSFGEMPVWQAKLLLKSAIFILKTANKQAYAMATEALLEDKPLLFDDYSGARQYFKDKGNWEIVDAYNETARDRGARMIKDAPGKVQAAFAALVKTHGGKVYESKESYADFWNIAWEQAKETGEAVVKAGEAVVEAGKGVVEAGKSIFDTMLFGIKILPIVIGVVALGLTYATYKIITSETGKEVIKEFVKAKS